MADAWAQLPPSLQEALTRHIHHQDWVEVVYRDPIGQIQTVRTRIRDLFNRPGGCFVALESGQLVPFRRVLMLNGQTLNHY